MDIEDKESLRLEYETIHKRIVQWSNSADLWDKILIPLSVGIIYFVITTGKSYTSSIVYIPLLLGIGFVLASIPLYIGGRRIKDIDDVIKNLYPRIIEIECELKMRFYFYYLCDLLKDKCKGIEIKKDPDYDGLLKQLESNGLKGRNPFETIEIARKSLFMGVGIIIVGLLALTIYYLVLFYSIHMCYIRMTG